MRKRGLFILLVMCICTMMHTNKAFAASNSYPTTQTVNSVITISCTRYAWQMANEKADSHKAENYSGKKDGFHYSVNIDSNEVTIIEYIGKKTKVSIPKKIDGYKVTKIADLAFHYCDKITSIKIPNGVKKIGYEAFEYCSSLTSITIPKSVEYIGEFAFANCSNLKSLKVQKGVDSIGDYAFTDCVKLESVEIPTTTKIGRAAFAGTALLDNNEESLMINNHYIYFGEKKDVIVPQGVKSVDFTSARSIESIKLPSSIKNINKSAFDYCTTLKQITLPKGVKIIEDHAFSACESIKSIKIPNGIKKIGWGAFSGCTSLESINLPKRITSIGNYAFSHCTSLKSINIPNSVTSIGEEVFGGCSSLITIKVKKGSYADKYFKKTEYKNKVKYY